MNGTRGQGTLQISVGAREYWIASSDPARDEPRRRQALRASGGDPWAALELLGRRALRQNPSRRSSQAR